MEIIFENEHYLVVNKNNGLIVEENPYENSLEGEVRKYLLKNSSKPFVGVVHRLDRVTSGAIVFAKKKSTLKYLNGLIEKRQFSKTYLVVVEGVLLKKKASLSNYLTKDLKNKRAIVNSEKSPNNQLAQLKYEVLQEKDNLSLLKIDLITGRFHQIRAQFSHLGHPVYGDEKYKSNFTFEQNSICLHSRSLAFVDPESLKSNLFTAELPEIFPWTKFKID